MELVVFTTPSSRVTYILGIPEFCVTQNCVSGTVVAFWMEFRITCGIPHNVYMVEFAVQNPVMRGLGVIFSHLILAHTKLIVHYHYAQRCILPASFPLDILIWQ